MWTERESVDGKSPGPESSESRLLLTVRRTKDVESQGHWNSNVYYPQDVAGLYLEFAAATPTREGITAFANRYGVLGIGQYYCGRFKGLDSTNDEVFGESMENWAHQIGFMKLAVDAWEALRAQDLGSFRKAVATADKGGLFGLDQFPQALRWVGGRSWKILRTCHPTNGHFPSRAPILTAPSWSA